MAIRFQRSAFEMQMDVDMIDITSENPQPDDSWRATDSNGHEHHYDRGYPTLDLVVDARHWCNGDEGLTPHDPHWHVDEAHYECKECRQVVKPRMLPPFTPRSIQGTKTMTLSGPRSDGLYVTCILLSDEAAEIEAALPNVEDAAQRVIDAVPAERIISTSLSR